MEARANLNLFSSSSLELTSLGPLRKSEGENFAWKYRVFGEGKPENQVTKK